MDGKNLKNKLIFIVSIIIFIVLSSINFSFTKENLKNNKSNELSLSTVKVESEASGVELYFGGGYLLEISHKKKGEIYFSSGVSITATKNFALNFGVFVDYISSSQLIIDQTKQKLIFPGFECGLIAYPFGDTKVKPFLGTQIAVTLYPGEFARTSLLLGSKFKITKFFNIITHYSGNYITSIKLNQFYSHLFSIYFSFNL